MYYGYIEVEVRDMRSNGDVEHEKMLAGATRVVRIEDADADQFMPSDADGVPVDSPAALKKVEQAIREVRGAALMDDLQDRWRTATDRMTPEKMRRALEVLEA